MIRLRDLFITIFKINLVTFGGGTTIAPVILEEFQEKRKLITRAEMLDFLAVAQSGPGALAVSVSFLTGYRLRGIRGAIVAVIAAVLPPLLVITILYHFYRELASNYWVRAALRGMGGVISAVLIWTTFKLAIPEWHRMRILGPFLTITAFLIGQFTSFNTVYIILALIAIGILDHLRKVLLP